MRRRNNGCFCQGSSIKRGGRGGCNETEANEPPGWCIYAAVALVAVGCYLNALNCDFVHDDIPAVVRNRDVIGEASWSSVLNDDFWGTPMESINSHKSYRPFTTLTFRLNYLMAGLSPMWYHATNVALHAAACILVTRVSLVVAALRPGFAALAGLLFAAHPVHTEAVTGIVGRADVLACIFFLLSFLAYHGLWPGYASAHNNLGTLTIDDQAEYHFLAAINAQPGHVNAHYNLGRLYRRTNRTEQCIEMLRRCVSLDPAYAPAFRVLARIATGPATGELLRHVIHLQPRNPDALAEYAYWLYKNGKWLPSLRYYFKAMEIFPSHKPSLIGTLRILRSRGQWSRVHQLIIRWHLMLRAKRGGFIYRGDLYIRAWELQSESRQRTHQHQRNLCISENGCSRPRVASVSVQLEQDSNKSEQLQRTPRCNVRACRQPRKGKARVTAPTLLVQNFLETL